MSLDWKGVEVYKLVEQAAIAGLTEFGARHETAAKKSVYPGHGKLTGTYQRSIHYARPSYGFAGDNMKPRGNSPERSGRGGGADRKGDTIRIVVGSGMRYAGILERRYNVMQGAFDQEIAKLPSILQKFAREQGIDP